MRTWQRITASAVLLAAGLAAPGDVRQTGTAVEPTASNDLAMQRPERDATQSPDLSKLVAADNTGGTGTSSGETDGGTTKPSGTARDGPDESGAPTSPQTDAGAGDDGGAEMSSGVPEGFESRMKPQKTLVEVYFGDRQVATVMAEYTPETIEFLDPGKVIEALEGVRRTDELREAFRGPMPTNGGQVCVRPGQQDCGNLDPETIGVIFDRGRFRADLFVHPDFLVKQEREAPAYLGAPDTRGPALVQNLSANHSGNSLGRDRFSLFGRTRMGYGTSHIFSSWVSTTEQDLSVDELGFRKDFRDHQFTAGLYEPQNQLLTALRRDPLVGVGIERTFNRRRDQSSAFATDVEIVLDSRARVELLRAGRLYGARFYEAGRHEINTERLPSGAYNLQIRITESGGTTRTLERFFVKSQRLAPGGENLWFAHLGRVYQRDRDQVWLRDAGTLLARSGVQYRHREELGIGVAGAAVAESALGEITADWLTPWLQTHGSVFTSTEGSTGWLLRGQVSRDDWRLIVDSKRIDAVPPAPGRDYVLLPDSVQRERVEFRAPAAGGQYFASWRRLQRNNNPEQRTTTLGYTRSFRLGGHQTLNLNASVSRSNGDHEARLSLDWRFTTPQWQHQVRGTHRYSERSGADDGPSAQASSTWQDGDILQDDLEVTAGVEADESTQQASLDGQYSWQYGRGRAGVSYTQRQDSTNRRVSSASYDTNVLANADSAAVGGPKLNEAGVIIDLRGAEGAVFDIFVNGEKRFVARGGRRVALALRPYEEYEVAIRDRGTDFVHYDHQSRRVTLYPGNVETLKWELERVMIILGVLVTPEGEPLGGAVFKGTRGVTTSDPDGYFQGEIRGRDADLIARVGKSYCRVEAGPIEPENGVARLGRVPCYPIEDPGDIDMPEASPQRPTPR